MTPPDRDPAAIVAAYAALAAPGACCPHALGAHRTDGTCSLVGVRACNCTGWRALEAPTATDPSGNLAAFLLARITDDQIAAQAALERGSSVYDPAVLRDRKFILADSHHIPRWNPARVLAECEAKRELVALADPYDYGDDDGTGMSEHADKILRALARPYADHPDYRPEWRP